MAKSKQPPKSAPKKSQEGVSTKKGTPNAPWHEFVEKKSTKKTSKG